MDFWAIFINKPRRPVSAVHHAPDTTARTVSPPATGQYTRGSDRARFSACPCNPHQPRESTGNGLCRDIFFHIQRQLMHKGEYAPKSLSTGDGI